MNRPPLTILNISLDRGLLDPSRDSETQLRQLLYCRELPARIVHLVKAPRQGAFRRLDFDGSMSVVPCAVPHWSLFVPLALWQGALLLSQEKFDCIQTQEPYLTGLIGALLSARHRLPLLTGLYSDEVDNPRWLAERWLNRVANHVARIVLRHSRAARADSLAVARRVGAGGYCPVSYIPFLITHAQTLSTPQPNAAALRATLLKGQPGPLLLAVNRLEPEKNIPLMLRAVAQAVKERPGMVLAIAGSGRLQDALRQLAQELALDKLHWLGWVPAEEMAAHYQAADLLLVSSDRESAARVLSESLLAATPVLSTDTAGAREVVEESLSGCIVPVGDHAAFTAALLEMTKDMEQLREMGRYGQRSIGSLMTGPAVTAALRSWYTSAGIGTHAGETCSY